jgi:hypothetical protein
MDYLLKYVQILDSLKSNVAATTEIVPGSTVRIYHVVNWRVENEIKPVPTGKESFTHWA